MKLPNKTIWGKYKLGNWELPMSEKWNRVSEGLWQLTFTGVHIETGQIISGMKTIFYPSLRNEGRKLEKELRKKKVILTSLKFKLLTL